MGNKMAGWKASGVLLAAMVLTLAMVGASAGEPEPKKAGKTPAAQQMQAYQVYQAKCLGCHGSVADPERPGRTRDGWTVVVRYMDKHYVNLSDAEANLIIELLYSLRRGMEKDPG